MANRGMARASRTRPAWQAGFIVGAALLTGCVSWQSAYPTTTPTHAVDAGLAAKLDEAERLANDAGDRARLVEAISAYETVLAEDPANFRALSQLGQLTILLGAAYTEDKAEKGRLYQRAGDYNVAALYTNPEFRQLVDAGATLAEATRVLGAREMDPMGFWCQSVFYFFKERLGTFERIANFRWIQEAQQVLARMEEIDPDWRRGGIPFSLAVVNIALPASAGGDNAKAKEFIDTAVASHPGMIRNRWGRAKYYYSVMGNAAAFREDLNWVLRQDPRQGGPYAWNVYFQADARRLLAAGKPAP